VLQCGTFSQSGFAMQAGVCVFRNEQIEEYQEERSQAEPKPGQQLCREGLREDCFVSDLRKNCQSTMKEKNSRAPARRMKTATAAAMSAPFLRYFIYSLCAPV